MPRLLSGSTLRRGGSGEFLDLKGAMPQLPPTETTATGFSLITDELYRTFYRSSLGFVEFHTATMWSSLPEGSIRVVGSGTSFLSTSTDSGIFIVAGGVGIGGNMHVKEDIVVNELTIGRGYEGQNNIVFRGTATGTVTGFLNGQQNIVVGYDALTGIVTANKTISIGRNAFSTGTKISNSIAIGDSALEKSGTIDYRELGNITNIELQPSLTITNIVPGFPTIVTSDNHGLNSGDKIYITGVNGVIKNSTTLINDQSLYVQVYSSDTFGIYYNKELSEVVDGNGATAYINGGVITRPVILTVSDPLLTTGTYVYVDGVVGTIELNQNYYYVNQLSTDTFGLYLNSIMEIPVNGESFNSYVSGGTLYSFLKRDGNIAYGNSSAQKLIDGEDNIFIGNKVAQNLTTGSYNILVGNNRLKYLTTGSGNISLGGDNIVDGKDDQVNIGSVFYFDGDKELRLTAETTIGLGNNSTDVNNGDLRVEGGAGIALDLYIGGTLNVKSTATSTFFGPITLNTVTISSPNSLTLSVDSPDGPVTEVLGNLYLTSGATATNVATGSLRIEGGAGIKGDVYVGGTFDVSGNEDVNLSPDGANVYLTPSLGGTVDISPGSQGTINNMIIGNLTPADGYFDDLVANTLKILSTASSTSTTTGAVIVAGDVRVNQSIYSPDGNPDENFLIHTPKITVATVAPIGPRVGDFWIDPSVPAYMQYINDNGNKVWVQIGAI